MLSVERLSQLSKAAAQYLQASAAAAVVEAKVVPWDREISDGIGWRVMALLTGGDFALNY